MVSPIFLKLGGSLITDKTEAESVRDYVLGRLAEEIVLAKQGDQNLRLVLGHGSGSFGHVPAAKYNTRAGVFSSEDWVGFTHVSDAALRLNRLVVGALVAAGLPAISISPSASAICEDGHLHTINTTSITTALDHGLIPVIHGDVAFDTVRGGTIVSTEEVMACLAPKLRPQWLLLAGETEGVYDQHKKTIPHISYDSLPEIRAALGGSRGTDVTGGMATKVEAMLALTQAEEGLRVRVFSGLVAGLVQELLLRPETAVGTCLTA